MGARPRRLIPARAGKTYLRFLRTLMNSAHPRACGENGHEEIMKIPGLWLIPARAGKTPTSSPRLSASPAHPRACGENRATQYRMRANAGSSPRVRGKRLASGDLRQVLRLIPACAGKTTARRKTRMIPGSSPRVRGKPPPHARPSPSSPAHPRVCGENAVAAGGAHDVPGSSPRVRGKLVGHHPRRARPGLIPACAGKTPRRLLHHPAAPAHPRVCGENPSNPARKPCGGGSSPRVRGKPGGRAWRACRRGGSSPRVRGKQPARHRHEPVGGLIPACAGKTRGDPHPWTAGPAHPRVCGENDVKKTNDSDFKGSSPRVRGKRTSGPRSPWTRRLIPACAGKTPARTVATPRPWAHPRVCGEN